MTSEDHGRLPIPAAGGRPAAARASAAASTLLPSLFTLGNMFCGYACIVYAMRGEYETAAPFIGFAIVLDMLDGRIARLTGTASDFGVEFDSLADVISFGIAPAILSFAWGLSPLGRLGWAAGFLFVTAAAMRLARFNIQSRERRRQALLRRHAEPGRGGDPGGDGLRVSRWRLSDYRAGAAGAARWCSCPALLMVSTIRFRSFKTIDLQMRRPYTVLLLIAVGDHAHRHAPAGRARRDGLHLPRVGLHRHGDHPPPPAGGQAGGGGGEEGRNERCGVAEPCSSRFPVLCSRFVFKFGSRFSVRSVRRF